DVLNTYLVWLRLILFCGKINEEDYAAEQDTFRAFLESQAQGDKPFISDFLAKWPE
ncbi:MAG: 3'-5' exonuclease, partial [Pyrinomonadaceae bacterium]